MKLTLKELVTAAQELPAAEKLVLAYYLQQPSGEDKPYFTREQALAELQALRDTGAFEKTESLMGKYSVYGIDTTPEELHATLREAATEWTSELDEFSSAITLPSTTYPAHPSCDCAPS